MIFRFLKEKNRKHLYTEDCAQPRLRNRELRRGATDCAQLRLRAAKNVRNHDCDDTRCALLGCRSRAI